MENSETSNSPNTSVAENFPIILQPRSETLISIPVPDHQEKVTFLVPAQTLSDSILCSNTINQVPNQKIIVAAINPTEFPVQITEQQIRTIKIKKFDEAKVHSIQKEPETVGPGNRIAVLRDAINTEHLNVEERESIVTICEQYSDIFHLEGDKLSCTDAV